jgi:hypothetical protein
MPKRIVFFNCFHNGDIHASRGFLRPIMNKIKQLEPDTLFSYSHKMAAELLSDIPELTFDRGVLGSVGNEHANLVKSGDTTFINTWYGQQHHKYMDRHGISIDTVYAALDDSCKDLYGFSLSDISTDPSVFFPTIDYARINTARVKNWLSIHPGKKILIENGQALSDQATNFQMGPIIDSLAQKHPDKIFILTSNESVANSSGNIFFSDSITQRKGRSDLNEISFLSTHCDVIIGRSSGVFAFTLTQENLFNRKITYFNFSNLVPIPADKYWLSDLLRDKIHYNSTIISSNESDRSTVFQMIDGGL